MRFSLKMTQVLCRTCRGSAAALLFVSAALALNCQWLARAQAPDLAEISSLIRQGKLEPAERALQNFLSKQPNSAKARSLLGVVYMRETRYADAETSFLKAIQIDPNLFEARRNVGDAYLAEGKIEAAKGAYLDALRINPQDAKANLALATLYLNMGQFTASLDAAGKIPPAKRTPDLFPILAGDYFGMQQQQKAAVEIQAMIQIAGKNPDLVPQLAELLLDHGAFRSAEEVLIAAAPRQKQTDRFLLDLARAEDGLGKREEALHTLSLVLQRSSRSLDALVLAGRVSGENSDWNQAVGFFKRAQKLAPERIDILQGLVTALLYANLPNEALESARRLQSLQPDDPRAAYYMALSLFGVHKWEDAKPYAAKVLAVHPEDREMNLTMAGIVYDLHDLPEARKHLEICLKQNPADPGALYYLGLIEKTEGDLEGATKSLAKSVAGNPKNSDAQSALGGLCLQVGDLSCARDALEHSILLSPGESQNHYQLSLTYTRLGLTQQAHEQLLLYEKLKAEEQKAPATTAVSPISGRPTP
jgi:tetratricopeptide (TPR) repeat protein